VRFALLQGLPSTARRDPYEPQPPPLGFHAPTAPSASGVHIAAGVQPAAFRPRGFTPPRRFTPPDTLQAYFIPQAPMGFCPSGDSPPKEPHHLFGGTVPSWRLFPTCTAVLVTAVAGAPDLRIANSQRSLPRLHGLAPPGSPFTATSRLSTPQAGPLVGFGLLRVFPSPMDETDFAASPPTRLNKHRFRKLPSGSDAHPRLGVLLHRQGGIASLEAAVPFRGLPPPTPSLLGRAPGPGFLFTSSPRWRCRSL
jgi:hypothetical protein